MKEVFLVTKNPHKLSEIAAVLRAHGIVVKQLALEKEEDKLLAIEEVASRNAKRFAEQEQKPVLVDDTGVFFDAYPGFPGPQPKRVFEQIGYPGLLARLEGKPRGAAFRTAAAFCRPGGEPVVEVGELRGTISETVFGQELDVMPFERIFIPDGYDKAMCFLAREFKNRLSHRGIAFTRLAKVIQRS
ncbi:MAG: non-canonical purine NTP pyrophosphatase [Nanoarchaeota archaeon]